MLSITEYYGGVSGPKVHFFIIKIRDFSLLPGRVEQPFPAPEAGALSIELWEQRKNAKIKKFSLLDCKFYTKNY